MFGNGRQPIAAVFGCAGGRLTADERAFFRDADPLGLILFRRNCESPEQLRALTGDFRDCVGRDEAPVLIDQEGGRVARLRPPHWVDTPAAARFGRLALTAPDKAEEAVRLNARMIAEMLGAAGVTVNAAPVLDLPLPDADDVIGDRAFCSDGEVATRLGRAVRQGLLDGGVLPVIKHIPGHGCALVDSHKSLPVVTRSLEQLQGRDFEPFRALAATPWAMTAHVVYTAVDPDRPATQSAAVIRDVIRGWIGFNGVLITDDLGMGALDGTPADRAVAALAAGCDLALHCSGVLHEMAAMAAAVPPVSAITATRLARGEAMRRRLGPVDVADLRHEVDTLLAAG